MTLFMPLNPRMLSTEDANRLSEKLAFALDLMMGAYERRIRSDCKTPEQLEARPWECAEWRNAQDAIRAYRVREIPMNENPLALAILKFAPDLAIELKMRWEAAQKDGDEALNRFLAFLRGGSPEGKSDVAG